MHIINSRHAPDIKWIAYSKQTKPVEKNEEPYTNDPKFRWDTKEEGVLRILEDYSQSGYVMDAKYKMNDGNLYIEYSHIVPGMYFSDHCERVVEYIFKQKNFLKEKPICT